jgi:hypothetical protein
MKRLHEDFFVGLFLIAIGTVIFVIGSTFNAPSVDPLGSSFYPKMIGGLIIGGGLLMVITSVIVSVRVGAVVIEHDPINFKLVSLFFMAVVYVAVLGKIGFVLANVSFMVGSLFIFGERNKKRLIVLPVGFTTFLVILFRFLLNVNLPTGSLWGM